MEILLKLAEIPVWIYVVVALLSVYYLYLTWTFDYWRKRGIPGNKPYPFMGTVKPFWKYRIEDQDVECVKKYGRFFGGFESRQPALFTTDPELIRQVTVKDFAVFPNRRKFEILDKYISKMLSLLRDDEWRAVRNTLTPSYTTGKLKQMVCLIEECVENLVKSIETKIDDGESVEMTDHTSVLTLDIIASCAFGMKIDCIQNPRSEFVTKARKAFRTSPVISYFVFAFASLFKYLQILNIKILLRNPFEYFTDIAHNTIEMRLKNKTTGRRDFLQIMLESEIQDESKKTGAEEQNSENSVAAANKQSMTHDTIIAQTILFILAGHETTANTLSFLLYELAMNPDIQDKLLSEVDDVMNECKGKITYEAIASMQYLDTIVSETLRLYPPVSRIERLCEKDKYEINGITIDNGVIVLIPIYAIHHDPEFYPNPEVFDPNRFSPENKAKRNPFTYIPFGSGPRNCVAMRFALMEVKIAVVLLFSKFRFSSCEKTEFPMKLLPAAAGFLQPKSVNLKLQKRIDQPHFN